MYGEESSLSSQIKPKTSKRYEEFMAKLALEATLRPVSSQNKNYQKTNQNIQKQQNTITINKKNEWDYRQKSNQIQIKKQIEQIVNYKQNSNKNIGLQIKLQRNMLEVKDKLEDLIEYINSELQYKKQNKPSTNLNSKTKELNHQDKINKQSYQNRYVKQHKQIKKQGQQRHMDSVYSGSLQYSLLDDSEPNIKFNENVLDSAKQVNSQQLIMSRQRQNYINYHDYQTTPLPKISQVISSQHFQSQIKLQDRQKNKQKNQFISQNQKYNKEDQQYNIIKQTINKKAKNITTLLSGGINQTISRTTLEQMGNNIKKNKFWSKGKLQTVSHHTLVSRQQTQDNRQLDTSIQQMSPNHPPIQAYYPFPSQSQSQIQSKNNLLLPTSNMKKINIVKQAYLDQQQNISRQPRNLKELILDNKQSQGNRPYLTRTQSMPKNINYNVVPRHIYNQQTSPTKITIQLSNSPHKSITEHKPPQRQLARLPKNLSLQRIASKNTQQPANSIEYTTPIAIPITRHQTSRVIKQPNTLTHVASTPNFRKYSNPNQNNYPNLNFKPLVINNHINTLPYYRPSSSNSARRIVTYHNSYNQSNITNNSPNLPPKPINIPSQSFHQPRTLPSQPYQQFHNNNLQPQIPIVHQITHPQQIIRNNNNLTLSNHQNSRIIMPVQNIQSFPSNHLQASKKLLQNQASYYRRPPSVDSSSVHTLALSPRYQIDQFSSLHPNKSNSVVSKNMYKSDLPLIIQQSQGSNQNSYHRQLGSLASSGSISRIKMSSSSQQVSNVSPLLDNSRLSSRGLRKRGIQIISPKKLKQITKF